MQAIVYAIPAQKSRKTNKIHEIQRVFFSLISYILHSATWITLYVSSARYSRA